MKDLGSSNKRTREQHLDWWDEYFAGRTLAEVTPDKIAEGRDALMAQTCTRGKEHNDKNGNVVPPKEYKRSGATVNRYLATLSHVFTLAHKEWRLVQSNPLREITKKKEARGRVRFLTDADAMRCSRRARSLIGPRCMRSYCSRSPRAPAVANSST
jgi:integrase